MTRVLGSITELWNPCKPWIGFPTEVLSLAPEWSTCTTAIWPLLDPPIAVTTQVALVPEASPAQSIAAPTPTASKSSGGIQMVPQSQMADPGPTAAVPTAQPTQSVMQPSSSPAIDPASESHYGGQASVSGGSMGGSSPAQASSELTNDLQDPATPAAVSPPNSMPIKSPSTIATIHSWPLILSSSLLILLGPSPTAVAVPSSPGTVTIAGVPISFGPSEQTPLLPTSDVFAIEGQTFTALPFAIVADGTTITPGGAVATVGGIPVSLGNSELVEGTRIETWAAGQAGTSAPIAGVPSTVSGLGVGTTAVGSVASLRAPTTSPNLEDLIMSGLGQVGGSQVEGNPTGAAVGGNATIVPFLGAAGRAKGVPGGGFLGLLLGGVWIGEVVLGALALRTGWP